MTKVQISFPLASDLTEEQMRRIADLYGTYGILRIKVDKAGHGLGVEYDATRFSPADVEAALARAGMPLAPRAV